MTFDVDYRRCRVEINADSRTIRKLDNLLEEARVQRSVAVDENNEQIVYHLPHESEVTKAEGVLEAAKALTPM